MEQQLNLAQRIARILYAKKAQDIRVLHVAQLTVITDYMVIASGRSSLQVKSLADDVDDQLAMEGVALRAKEGNAEGRWIVLDYGSVLVHIFHPDERQYYNMERLWLDTPDACIRYSLEQDSKLQQQE